jgi:hypothetical protein
MAFALIWSSGEYRVTRGSLPNLGQPVCAVAVMSTISPFRSQPHRKLKLLLGASANATKQAAI